VGPPWSAMSNEIELMSLDEPRKIPEISAPIQEVADENYANAPVLLEQEYQKNSKIYLSAK